MPSFPGSVFAPANRSNGQTIDASHVNGVQDELVAIEGGYLNGTARLNSSASTLASLDVNGNSTLASSITLGTIPYVMPSSGGSTGNVLTCISTSGSTMTLEWRVGAGATADAARVELDAAVQLAVNSTTRINWTAQAFVTNSSMHSTGTNPSRLIPQSTGVYLFTVQADFRGGSTDAFISIEDSSATRIAYTSWRLPAAAEVLFNAVGLKRFDVTGGYAVVVVNAQAASTGSLGPAELSFFSMARV